MQEKYYKIPGGWGSRGEAMLLARRGLLLLLFSLPMLRPAIARPRATAQQPTLVFNPQILSGAEILLHCLNRSLSGVEANDAAFSLVWFSNQFLLKNSYL